MLEPTPAGRSKLDAATAAARGFLDLLRLGTGDQAALVAFNATASLLVPLTADRAALDAAFGRIEVAQQTCLACGVETAAAEIDSPRREPANTPVLILLTDGRSNPRPAADAVARAAEAKARGVVVFTIGLGTDVDTDALAAIASRPDGFYQAPVGEDLAAIYGRIAVALPCPAGAFWGRR
jgi:Mg-chelatase subunit ChlD